MSRREASQLADRLQRYLRESGSEFTVGMRGGHWHVFTADGHSIASFPGSPRSHRFRANTIARLRQRGIVPRDWR